MSGAKKAAGQCILISLCCGLGASFILFCSSDFIVEHFLHNRISPFILHLICLALPTIAVSSAINGYFTAARKVYKTACSQFFEQIIKIIATYFLISLFLPSGLEYACFCLILADVISEIASFLLSAILYYFDVQALHSNRHTHSYTKKIFSISLPVAITSYVRSGLSTLKQLLIPSSLEKNSMSCSAAFSTYGTIFGMTMPVIMFPSLVVSAFSGLLVPEFARFRAKHDEKRAREVIRTVFLVTGIFSLLLTVVFFCFAENLAMLFYHSTEVSPYIKIFSILTIFMYLDIVVDSILKGLDAQVSVMMINILDLLITVTLTYCLVPVLGIIGLMISVFASEIFNFTCSTIKLYRVTHKEANICFRS